MLSLHLQPIKVADMPLNSYQQLDQQYGSDVDRICNDHERLVEMILEEEEELIGSHRQHIDDVVDLVKQELMLVRYVDKPGSDIEEYVGSLLNPFAQNGAYWTCQAKTDRFIHTS